VINQTMMLALAVSGLLLAQQQAEQQPSPVAPANATSPDNNGGADASHAESGGNAATGGNATSGSQPPQWKGLTVKEKLDYDWQHLFDPENLVFAGIGAGFDQLRDRPGQWGEGWGAFAGRYGSHLGQYVVQRGIMFPVQAIDHEDTRYFRSARKTYKGRLADAFLHTAWRHDDSGGMMPAYSEFLGDYGAAAASRFWWPRQYHNRSSIFVAGSDTVLIDAGINVFREFTPDIKRWLHLSH
jgi:hypothetical protein